MNTHFPSELTKQIFRVSANLFTLLAAGVAIVTVSLAAHSAVAEESQQTTTGAQTVVNVAANTFVAVPIIAASPTPSDLLTITKSDDREVVRAGEIVTYRIRVRSLCNYDLTEIKIVDHVPQYLIPLKITPEGTADPKTRTVTWKNQTISALAEVTFSYTARVDRSTPDGFVLTNTAVINGPGVHGSASDTTKVQSVLTPPSPTPVAPATPKPPLTVSAPKPVPLAPRTGMDVTSLLLSLGGMFSGTGTLLLLKKTRA